MDCLQEPLSELERVKQERDALRLETERLRVRQNITGITVTVLVTDLLMFLLHLLMLCSCKSCHHHVSSPLGKSAIKVRHSCLHCAVLTRSSYFMFPIHALQSSICVSLVHPLLLSSATIPSNISWWIPSCLIT